MRSKFKDEHPFERRKAEADRIRQKYTDRVPVSIVYASALTLTHISQVICEKVERSDIAVIDKKKYLVPADLTVGERSTQLNESMDGTCLRNQANLSM